MESKDTVSPFVDLPIMAQSPEQSAWFKKHVSEHPENAYCLDCKRGQATHANMLNGTYLCTACAEEHKKLFPLISRVKAITEVFDEHQLRTLACSGGNITFIEWMKQYDGYVKQFTIEERYKSDAA